MKSYDYPSEQICRIHRPRHANAELLMDALPNTTIRVDYSEGNRNLSPPGHDTGWRTMPCAVLTHNMGSRLLMEVRGTPPTIIENAEAGLVPAGIEHRFEIIGSTPQRSTWCHIQYVVHETVDLLSLFKLPSHWKGAEAKDLKRHCGRLIRLNRINDANPLVLQANIQQAGLSMLTTLLKRAEPKATHRETTSHLAKLEPALQYLRTHLAHPITLPELADVVYLSRSRFADLFSQTLGVAPMRYLKQLRLERAQMLLMSSDLPVGEIGKNCGYPDPFHFSRTFKAEFSQSPRSFRNHHRARSESGPTY